MYGAARLTFTEHSKSCQQIAVLIAVAEISEVNLPNAVHVVDENSIFFLATASHLICPMNYMRENADAVRNFEALTGSLYIGSDKTATGMGSLLRYKIRQLSLSGVLVV